MLGVWVRILDTDNDNLFRVCSKVPESDAGSVGHTDNDDLFRVCSKVPESDTRSVGHTDNDKTFESMEQGVGKRSMVRVWSRCAVSGAYLCMVVSKRCTR